jgi:hypothetical protein
MNLSNALNLLLQSEAKRPAQETVLFDTTIVDRNTENFHSNDTWWRTGALCIGMLHHNPSIATVMIIVGAKENKRYAITTESTPALVEFSTNDMKQVNMRLAKTSTERDTKLFVTTDAPMCSSEVHASFRYEQNMFTTPLPMQINHATPTNYTTPFRTLKHRASKCFRHG